MLYLHKILPLLFLPIGLTIACIVTGLLWRKRQLCWAGAILLWISSTNWVGDVAMLAVEAGAVQPPVQAIPAAEAIVALVGGLRQQTDGALPDWTDGVVNRFEAGVALLKAGKAPLLILTNGLVPWGGCALPIQDSLMTRARELGVPEEALQTTQVARNTAEEADAVAELLLGEQDGGGAKEIILVTSAFHMARAKLLFERAGFAVVPFPADFQVCRKGSLTVLDFLPCAEGLRHTEMALREWYGYAYYKVMKGQESGGQRSEVGGRRSEVGCQRSEGRDRCQMSDVGGRGSGVRIGHRNHRMTQKVEKQGQMGSICWQTGFTGDFGTIMNGFVVEGYAVYSSLLRFFV